MSPSPLPNSTPPLFSTPVLWTIRVLALSALAVSSYLVYTSLGHSTVAGCAGTGAIDCEAVFGTTWSKWLGLPVSVGGLGCYAGLLVLSFLVGWQHPLASRWVPTLIVLLSVVAAGAGLWFAGLQLFVVHKICFYCMGVHLTGVTIACLVLWSVFRSRMGLHPDASQRMATLASAMHSSVPRQSVTAPTSSAEPSLPWALSGAGVILAVLIGGQILAPANTYKIEQATLDEKFDFSDSPSVSTVAQSTPSESAQTHVVHRMPAETEVSNESEVDKKIQDPNVVPAAAAEEAEPDVAVEKEEKPPVPAKVASSAHAEVAEPAPAAQEARPERKVTLLNDSLTLDVYDQAILGSPDAPHVIVELMDYTCPHCRDAHAIIKKAHKKYGSQLAIVIMPVPLESECNKYMRGNAGHAGACKLSKLALSVWTIKPSAFPRYHDFLMEDKDKAPAVSKAIIQAFNTVDGKQLRDLTDGDDIQARIARDIELYVKLSKTRQGLGLPIQIVGDKILSGKVNADKMTRTWEKELGIEPK